MDLENSNLVFLKDVYLRYPLLGRQKANLNAAQRRPKGASSITSHGGRNAGVNALENINLLLRPGDRLALVGRNGAGKTTLLKVISQIFPPTSGIAYTQGNISTLFQMGLGMRPTATGHRNIELQCMVAGLSRPQIDEIREDIIEFTELGDFLNLPVNTYSQGMAMRLNFAIATATKPDILIMDEWIGAGDSAFRKKAADRMQSTFKSAGIAVLASHNKNLLRRMCNLGLWMDSGRQMAFGPLEDVMERMDAYYESDTGNANLDLPKTVS